MTNGEAKSLNPEDLETGMGRSKDTVESEEKLDHNIETTKHNISQSHSVSFCLGDVVTDGDQKNKQNNSRENTPKTLDGSFGGDARREDEKVSGAPAAAPTRPSMPTKPGMSYRNLKKKDREEFTFVLFAGLCLAFNSGYINGACLSGLLLPDGTSQSVSAFTGTYTKSALALAAGEVSDFGNHVLMVLSFIFGAFLTGAINPRGKSNELTPQYGPTFLLGGALLTVSCVFSWVKPKSHGVFFFAAAANGLQNGMSSMYSGNLIRSTHYTGTSTDIGLITGQCCRGNFTSLWKLWVLIGLTVSFWMGGFFSFHVTSYYKTQSLLFNTVFFFFIGTTLIMFVAYERGVSVWQAATGTWAWEKALDQLSSRFLIVDEEGGNASGDFLLKIFDEIDTDGSGSVEEDKLYFALKKAGMKVSKRIVKAMMATADENNDGEISKEEWEILIMGLQQNKAS